MLHGRKGRWRIPVWGAESALARPSPCSLALSGGAAAYTSLNVRAGLALKPARVFSAPAGSGTHGSASLGDPRSLEAGRSAHARPRTGSGGGRRRTATAARADAPRPRRPASSAGSPGRPAASPVALVCPAAPWLAARPPPRPRGPQRHGDEPRSAVDARAPRASSSGRAQWPRSTRARTPPARSVKARPPRTPRRAGPLCGPGRGRRRRVQVRARGVRAEGRGHRGHLGEGRWNGVGGAEERKGSRGNGVEGTGDGAARRDGAALLEPRAGTLHRGRDEVE